MTNADELIALAERCEAATGPDRELDAAIVAIVKAGWRSPWFISPPDFTASLDAAATLAPKGWGWQVSDTGTAGIWSKEAVDAVVAGGMTFPGVAVQVSAKAATPALGLTAAALRARAAHNSTGLVMGRG